MQLIDRADEVLVVSHRRPDGDAIGSTVAVLATLEGRGNRAWGLLLDPVPMRYRSLIANGRIEIEIWSQGFDPGRIDRAGAIVLLDASSWEQLDVVREPLSRAADRLVVVDHHETHDGLSPVELIDPTAAATGLIIYEWFKFLKLDFPPVAREAIFAALATDTGWFRFSNTDARALRAAAELVQMGVEVHRCYEAIYWSESPARLALMAKALAGMTLHLDGRLAVMQIDQACLSECQAGQSDTEDLINEPMRIASVAVSALLVEEPTGRIRVSLRSKRGLNDATVAKLWAGGGHARAAGGHLPGPLEAAYQQVLRLLSEALACQECP